MIQFDKLIVIVHITLQQIVVIVLLLSLMTSSYDKIWYVLVSACFARNSSFPSGLSCEWHLHASFRTCLILSQCEPCPCHPMSNLPHCLPPAINMSLLPKMSMPRKAMRNDAKTIQISTKSRALLKLWMTGELLKLWWQHYAKAV